MTSMPAHVSHESHPHAHGPACGHAPIPHGDHTDYLHDGHVHRPHRDHTDEAFLQPTDVHVEHVAHEHAHGPGCGHEAVVHDGHPDYVHDEHRHAVHGDHVDEH